MNSALNFKYQDKPSIKQGVMTLNNNNKVSLYSEQFGKKLIYNAKTKYKLALAQQFHLQKLIFLLQHFV